MAAAATTAVADKEDARPIPFSVVIAGLDPAIHRPWMNRVFRWMPGSSPGKTTRGSVSCLTQAPTRFGYPTGVAERSTMVVGLLSRPSGRFLPRLGPAAPAGGAFFAFAPSRRSLGEVVVLGRTQKNAPAKGRRANVVSAVRLA